jgi:hypothetical protein
MPIRQSHAQNCAAGKSPLSRRAALFAGAVFGLAMLTTPAHAADYPE